MRLPQATRGEPAGVQNSPPNLLCDFNINVIYSNPRSTHPHGGIPTYQ